METCYWTLGPEDQSEVFRFGCRYSNSLNHLANPAVLVLTILLPLDVTRLKQLAKEVSAPCAVFPEALAKNTGFKHLDFFLEPGHSSFQVQGSWENIHVL